ncbi:MAG: DUF4390 domain-containing protein [Thermodesulfovibrionia bacterium]|nr:DUF4390 domain-containing protein [Thermodesulfovibrionia bacterium]
MTTFTFIIISSSVCFLFILIPATALTVELMEPEIIIQDNNILVNTGLTDIEELETTIKSGIEKEIVFTIDLFRAWNFWPDEFVVSKKIHKIIKYDDLRGQYLASSYDGTEENKKKFKKFDDSMKDWFFTAKEVDLANIKELDPGNYYIRVVAESKSRKLPPVIGFLMLFIPEVEMSFAKESQVLNFGNQK